MELTAEEFSSVAYDFGKPCFPRQVNGKLKTADFLIASKGVVRLIDKLGKVFSPLSSDVSGNIEKIIQCYEKNPSEYCFIEDMILCDKLENKELCIDALLWLRRALHFISIFFQNIINDSAKKECLQEHMSSAYSQALEPYHGWVAKNLFRFFKSMVPSRSKLLSALCSDDKEEAKENLVRFLTFYIQCLAENVNHITLFYNEHNLDPTNKV